ncbi:hypothetical protein LSAT2_012824 [Lamellibrachia satsuma]|nr:hypothetical protein LSAT2_012824 [Lamellibrachia satsuma]
MLLPSNLPPEVETPPSLSMLKFECHYHLGVALQYLGEHGRAVRQYTGAMSAVFSPKNGCVAGCHSNSCLMTPLYARRALAHTQTGKIGIQ